MGDLLSCLTERVGGATAQRRIGQEQLALGGAAPRGGSAVLTGEESALSVELQLGRWPQHRWRPSCRCSLLDLAQDLDQPDQVRRDEPDLRHYC